MNRMEWVGVELRVEVEPIETTSYSPRRDPSWTFTDAAGHIHDATAALLVRKQDDPDEPPFYFDEDGDEYNAPDHLECSLCGEWITPDTIGPDPWRTFTPGPMTGTLHGTRSDGTDVTINLSREQVEQLQAGTLNPLDLIEAAPTS